MTTNRTKNSTRDQAVLTPISAASERWHDADELRWAARHWAVRIGVKIPRIQVRAMATKWASVSTAGRLTLNSELVAIPEELGEFVIVHELVHLLAPNHGKVFTSFLHAYLPDWQQRERDLRRYAGPAIRSTKKPDKRRATGAKPAATPQSQTAQAAPVPPVLVVDDDPGIRRMLTEVLDLEGYRVRLAEHGGVGLEQMRASEERMVVLLGLSMPEVNGEEVLEAVAADITLAGRHAIVVVTGSRAWATGGRVAELRRQLGVPLLPKPFNVMQLLDAVETAARQLH